MKNHTDFLVISYNFIREGFYTNCSEKDPEENQGFDEEAEKIVDKSNTVNSIRGLDISFGSMFSTKAKLIGWVIAIIASHNSSNNISYCDVVLLYKVFQDYNSVILDQIQE
jgi:hypothetical protein